MFFSAASPVTRTLWFTSTSRNPLVGPKSYNKKTCHLSRYVALKITNYRTHWTRTSCSKFDRLTSNEVHSLWAIRESFNTQVHLFIWSNHVFHCSTAWKDIAWYMAHMGLDCYVVVQASCKHYFNYYIYEYVLVWNMCYLFMRLSANRLSNNKHGLVDL